MRSYRLQCAATAASAQPPPPVRSHRRQCAAIASSAQPPPPVRSYRLQWAATAASAQPPPSVRSHRRQCAATAASAQPPPPVCSYRLQCAATAASAQPLPPFSRLRRPSFPVHYSIPPSCSLLPLHKADIYFVEMKLMAKNAMTTLLVALTLSFFYASLSFYTISHFSHN